MRSVAGPEAFQSACQSPPSPIHQPIILFFLKFTNYPTKFQHISVQPTQSTRSIEPSEPEWRYSAKKGSSSHYIHRLLAADSTPLESFHSRRQTKLEIKWRGERRFLSNAHFFQFERIRTGCTTWFRRRGNRNG